MSITIIIRIGIENQHLVNQRRLQLRVGLVQAVIDIFVVFEVFFFFTLDNHLKDSFILEYTLVIFRYINN